NDGITSCRNLVDHFRYSRSLLSPPQVDLGPAPRVRDTKRTVEVHRASRVLLPTTTAVRPMLPEVLSVECPGEPVAPVLVQRCCLGVRQRPVKSKVHGQPVDEQHVIT